MDLKEILKDLMEKDLKLAEYYRASVVKAAEIALERCEEGRINGNKRMPHSILNTMAYHKEITKALAQDASSLCECAGKHPNNYFVMAQNKDEILDKLTKEFVYEQALNMIKSMTKKFGKGAVETIEIINLHHGMGGFEGQIKVNGEIMNCRTILAWGYIVRPHYRYIWK